ncbi:MAG: hypothetical protein GX303_01295 [Clostridiales bacterium]|nr:hypothetical protein [Clostridiales bacterium]
MDKDRNEMLAKDNVEAEPDAGNVRKTKRLRRTQIVLSCALAPLLISLAIAIYNMVIYFSGARKDFWFVIGVMLLYLPGCVFALLAILFDLRVTMLKYTLEAPLEKGMKNKRYLRVISIIIHVLLIIMMSIFVLCSLLLLLGNVHIAYIMPALGLLFVFDWVLIFNILVFISITVFHILYRRSALANISIEKENKPWKFPLLSFSIAIVMILFTTSTLYIYLVEISRSF